MMAKGLYAIMLSAWTGTALAVQTLDEVQFWVGEGSNCAAMIVDWSQGPFNDDSLAWGYRWSGEATGADMFFDVLAADSRLRAKVSAPNGPDEYVALYGVGYDWNADGLFELTDGTAFNAAGFAVTDPADGAESADSADRYAEGWFTGVWNYGVASASPFAGGGAWQASMGGMSSRALVDGTWHGWTFAGTFHSIAVASQPHAAPVPAAPGDYDRDGVVDGADFLDWQRSIGAAALPPASGADGNADGVVNGADLTAWSSRFGDGGATSASSTVPEPGAVAMAAVCGLLIGIRRRRTRSQVSRKLGNDAMKVFAATADG